jgi:hypothetical protein
MSVHVIPVAFHCAGFDTRQDALEYVQRMLEEDPVHTNEPPDPHQVVAKFTNDDPDGEWWLRWAPGRPTEPLDEAFSYDPSTQSIHEEEG